VRGDGSIGNGNGTGFYAIFSHNGGEGNAAAKVATTGLTHPATMMQEVL